MATTNRNTAVIFVETGPITRRKQHLNLYISARDVELNSSRRDQTGRNIAQISADIEGKEAGRIFLVSSKSFRNSDVVRYVPNGVSIKPVAMNAGLRANDNVFDLWVRHEKTNRTDSEDVINAGKNSFQNTVVKEDGFVVRFVQKDLPAANVTAERECENGILNTSLIVLPIGKYSSGMDGSV